MPIDSLRDHLDELGGGPVVVYCEVGQRGHTATALLHELGFQVRNLDGGYQTWLAACELNRKQKQLLLGWINRERVWKILTAERWNGSTMWSEDD